MAEGTLVEVHPKGEPSALKLPRAAKRLAEPVSPDDLPSAIACPKIPKSKPVSVSEAVEMLRQWRMSVPLATRLDAGTGKQGNEHWLHITVDGYGEGPDEFRSRDGGPVFSGRDYNGIVNFHADAKTSAIDRLIELIDSEADDYHDVLRPLGNSRNTKASRQARQG